MHAGNSDQPTASREFVTTSFADLCQRMHAGDQEARDQLFRFAYDELRAIAGRKMSEQRADHTLEPTALVHEAYLRLSGGSTAIRDHGHLVAICACAMRHVLVDHARRKQTEKRSRRDPVDAVLAHYERASIDFLAFHEALDLLAKKDELAARLVERRFLAGESVEDCAIYLSIPTHQAYRLLRSARAFLHLKIEGAGGEE